MYIPSGNLIWQGIAAHFSPLVDLSTMSLLKVGISLCRLRLSQRSCGFQGDCLPTQEGVSTKYSFKNLAGGHNPRLKLFEEVKQMITPQFLGMLQVKNR